MGSTRNLADGYGSVGLMSFRPTSALYEKIILGISQLRASVKFFRMP